MEETTVREPIDYSAPGAGRGRGGGGGGAAPARRPVNPRSLVLGLAGVTFVCGLTPYNDYVVNNTFLVGNFLPIGLVLFLLVIIMGFNAPLLRWARPLAFSAGELAVAMGMMLVSCAIPSSGLMRYLPAQLVGISVRSVAEPELGRAFDAMRLPRWMFPRSGAAAAATMATTAGRASDPVYRDYYGRTQVPPGEDTFLGHVRRTPWGAWVPPMLGWGVLLSGLYGATLCGAVIVRRQWVENERLPFPLASVYLSLIESPERGRSFNPLLRSAGFWIAFASVFAVHGVNALHAYLPASFPEIPIGYDVRVLLGSSIWINVAWGLRKAQVYFSIVGIAFFLQTKVAFSLWFFFVLESVVMVAAHTRQYEITAGMRTDQLLGALIVYVLGVLWAGRAQWRLVARQMFRPPRDGEPAGRYLPYFAAGWGFVLCGGIVGAWLMAAGMSVAGVAVVLPMLGMMFLAMARIVAETGLIFVQLPLTLQRPWNLLGAASGGRMRTTAATYTLTTWFQMIFGNDLRECLPVYATHALAVADDAAYPAERDGRKTVPFTAALVLALAVGYVTAGASTLYVEYKYAATIDRAQVTPINRYGIDESLNPVVTGLTDYKPPRTGPVELHSRTGHFAFGAALTLFLTAMRLRFAAWPLHPVGYILVNSYPMQMTWFSILIGWMSKVAVVRFGGIGLFRRARAFFTGLIVGEAAAAAFWLVVSLVLVARGAGHRAIQLLPG